MKKKEKQAPVRTTYFAEALSLEEATLDAENKSVRVTLIRPGWSANNRYYSKAVLGESVKLWEQSQAYKNHPSKSERRERPERSVDDIFGWYENVQQEKDGRLTANLQVIDESMWPKIEAAATRNPKLIGLSINALGKTRMGEAEGKRGVIVEAIVSGNSTDAVTRPAAGGSFDSLLMSDGDSFTSELLAHIELQEFREARPDLIEALQSEWKAPRQDKALASAREEIAALKAQLAEAQGKVAAHTQKQRALESAMKAVKVDSLLASVTLPDEWKTTLHEDLLNATEADWPAIVQREIVKAKAIPTARAPVPVQGVGSRPPARPSPAPQAVGVVAEIVSLPESRVALPNESYSDYVKRTKGN